MMMQIRKNSFKTNTATSNNYAYVMLIVLHIINLVYSAPTSIINSDQLATSGQAFDQSFFSPTLDQFNMRPSGNEFSSPDPIGTIHYHFEKQMDPFMQLHKFNSSSYQGNNVACNDGSSAGYYKRLNNHSKSWIIYLQGGGFCGSEEACQQRWRRSSHLMSSNSWPKSKSVDGILSSEPKDNPFLWNANHIYVPYCSSDSWTGLKPGRGSSSSWSSSSGSVSGQQSLNQQTGSRIIEQVFESLFEELPRDSSLYEAKFILLAGDSAGATGVILNLDKLNKFVQLKFASNYLKEVPIFRGLADSGWFLDNEPYDYMDQYSSTTTTTSIQTLPALRYLSPNSYSHTQQSSTQQPASYQTNDEEFNQQQQQAQLLDCDRQQCGPIQSIRQAMHYWNGQVPASCAQRHQFEPWRCYFGYRTYQTLKTPLFVVQWLYDEAQLIVDNISRPDTISQWNYVNKLVSEMRASLENVTALFAPSCFSHSLIIKQSWNQININGFKLPHILNSWEEETLPNQPNIDALTTTTTTNLLSPESQIQSNLDLNKQTNNINNNYNENFNINNKQFNSHFKSTFQQQQQVPNIDSRISETTTTSSTLISNSNKLQAQQVVASPRSQRSRKRKRNNQGQQQQKISTATNGQALSALALSSNRLSRSTAIINVDNNDPTSQSTLFNNNVPDILSIITTQTNHRSQQEFLSDKFRLIDSCGWPQCNRDCPTLEQEINLRSITSSY